ncbi:MAG: PrsW family intramembrane metalloprotease [Deltaproteobacteria bacterium]|nr:PrsW family intramembrane metalloprotease [Deltaproteobacteria bacterium]
MDFTQLYVAGAGALPALVAMWIIDRLDAKRPEPRSLRRKVALFGGLACIPAIIIELVLADILNHQGAPQLTYRGAVLHATVVAAAVEEACKISVVYWLVWKRPEFDERMDGIVYAARAGLGFALVENILYMLQQQSLDGAIQTWVIRAALTVPGHAMWTGVMGYFAARRRFDRRGLGIVGGYLIAVAGHGLFDTAVFLGMPLRIEGFEAYAELLMLVPALIIVAFWLGMRRAARTALALDDADAARAMGMAQTHADAIAVAPAPPQG